MGRGVFGICKGNGQEGIELLAPKLHLANGKEIRLSLEIIDLEAAAEEKVA